VRAVFGLSDLDEGLFLSPGLFVLLLLSKSFQAVHSDVTMAAANGHKDSIVIQHSQGHESGL